MPTAIVTINGRRARLTGDTREAVQAKIDELTQGKTVTETSLQEPMTEQQPKTIRQEPKEGMRRPNPLEVIAMGIGEAGRAGGRAIASGLRGATFGMTPKAQPTTPGERVALPMSELAGAVAGAPGRAYTGISKAIAPTGAKLARRALGASVAGGVTGALTKPEEEDTIQNRQKQMIAGAVLSPLMEGGAKSAQALVGSGRKWGSRIVNSLVKPRQAEFAYGKNPGRTISKLKITANSLDDLLGKISNKMDERGKQIFDTITKTKPKIIKTNYADDVLKPLDEAINKLSKTPKTNATTITRLQNIRDDLSLTDLTKMTPEGAFNLKKTISDLGRWTGNPSDDKIVNNAVQQSYRNVKTALNKQFPKLKVLNEEYADLITASKAVNRRIDSEQSKAIIGFVPEMFGFLSSLTDGALTVGDLPRMGASMAIGAGFRKALQSTAVKTKVASGLTIMSEAKLAQAFANNPNLAKQIATAVNQGSIKLGKEEKAKVNNAYKNLGAR